MKFDKLSNAVIGLVLEVPKELGPGLLINFKTKLLKDGIKRYVLMRDFPACRRDRRVL